MDVYQRRRLVALSAIAALFVVFVLLIKGCGDDRPEPVTTTPLAAGRDAGPRARSDDRLLHPAGRRDLPAGEHGRRPSSTAPTPAGRDRRGERRQGRARAAPDAAAARRQGRRDRQLHRGALEAVREPQRPRRRLRERRHGAPPTSSTRDDRRGQLEGLEGGEEGRLRGLRRPRGGRRDDRRRRVELERRVASADTSRPTRPPTDTGATPAPVEHRAVDAAGDRHRPPSSGGGGRLDSPAAPVDLPGAVSTRASQARGGVSAAQAQPCRLGPGPVELGVAAARRDQLVVRARLGDPAVLEDDDPAGAPDRREPVGDHDRRAARRAAARAPPRSRARCARRRSTSPRRGSGSAARRAAPARTRRAGAGRPRAAPRARRPRSRSRRRAARRRRRRRPPRAAAMISASSASGRPKAMFSRIVPENRKPSCGTIPSWLRSARVRRSRRSCPSTSTRPRCGS